MTKDGLSPQDATSGSGKRAPPARNLCHQFPLRPGYLAQVVVPVDMTQEEAARLQAFLRSLAV